MSKVKENLFDVYYSDTKGKHLKVRYCCIDKSQAKRLFYSECRQGEIIIKIVKVD